MRSSESMALIAHIAARWAFENLERNEKGEASRIQSFGVTRLEAIRLVEPGEWTVMVHSSPTLATTLYQATFKFGTSGDSLILGIIWSIPNSIGVVETAVLVQAENENGELGAASSLTVTGSLKEAINELRDSRNRHNDVAKQWCLERFVPGVDSEVGTETTDWECLNIWEVNIGEKRMKSRWLRMHERSADTYNANDARAGVLLIEDFDDGEYLVNWEMNPSAEFRMSADISDKPKGFGGWE